MKFKVWLEYEETIEAENEGVAQTIFHNHLKSNPNLIEIRSEEE